VIITCFSGTGVGARNLCALVGGVGVRQLYANLVGGWW
jgi:hypothetical protein